ncbi:hypothetical protein [Methanoculleus sp. UBA303]|jgi:hypothetical protein|uniref:hypothetical protein n=1 Tax=Methanoculleus sp. UBA303 TaxID=1915497 RepID=UPI0025E85072|nr:hypothetical protein [Methanoculleus sp. UBA303]
MANFEGENTCRINRFFAHRRVQGFAYRLKQSKCDTQYVDVLVDSLDPRYHLAIECRSISGRRSSTSPGTFTPIRTTSTR